MTSQPGQQTTVIHILPNILSSRGNQIIEYNIRNIFLEKSYTELGGETSPRHISGKLKLSISLDQQSQLKQDILKLSCRLLVITYLAFFNKKRSGTIFCTILKKYLSNFYFFIKLQAFKNYEKCFLFHRKSSFRSQDIQMFVIFSLPFHIFQIQKGKWKWNNL